MELFEFLSDEVIVQLGMLADYAMQIQGLVRICDDEELDEAELPQDIMAQETVLRSLFLDKACLNFPGFTKVALHGQGLLCCEQALLRHLGLQLVCLKLWWTSAFLGCALSLRCLRRS